MAIKTSTIMYSQRVKLLESQEDHFRDFKSKKIKPAKITKTISAFANADGGDLYIGIDEDKENKIKLWRGFENVEEANGFIQIFEKLFPLGQEFSYEFLKVSDAGLVLHINIHKTHDIKKASDDKVYLRRGAQNLPVTTEEKLKRLRMNKGLVSHESATVSADLFFITESDVVKNFLCEVVPTTNDARTWLKKQLLIRNEKPTVSGVLLFSDEPQAIIPKHCGIKIARYKTIDSEGSRATLDSNPVTVEGCLYEQIYKAVDKTVEIIEQSPILNNGIMDKIDYPPETLHEIITNAILHRDYSIADDVHIRIFDNRIEVESPGTLPGHVTTKNILETRFSRNGSLVRIINKFPNPPNKDIGEGLNTAFQAMTKLRLKEPIIKQNENSLLVVIRHESLASPEELIMNHLKKHSEINNSIVTRICHIDSENKVSRILKNLVNENLIERIPGKQGRASAYRKKSNIK
ncbi:MAG: ATP-binding protein [Xenococcaceae cyanobacterium MO_167.B52]|nr:ATP-binding protein [Xenococcaceae cyanobacterium MO_167.B52]